MINNKRVPKYWEHAYFCLYRKYGKFLQKQTFVLVQVHKYKIIPRFCLDKYCYKY